jgi:hypothetical protein
VTTIRLRTWLIALAAFIALVIIGFIVYVQLGWRYWD